MISWVRMWFLVLKFDLFVVEARVKGKKKKKREMWF